MPSQHIELSLLSASTAAAAAERDTIHHSVGYRPNLGRHRQRAPASEN